MEAVLGAWQSVRSPGVAPSATGASEVGRQLGARAKTPQPGGTAEAVPGPARERGRRGRSWMRDVRRASTRGRIPAKRSGAAFASRLRSRGGSGRCCASGARGSRTVRGCSSHEEVAEVGETHLPLRMRGAPRGKPSGDEAARRGGSSLDREGQARAGRKGARPASANVKGTRAGLLRSRDRGLSRRKASWIRSVASLTGRRRSGFLARREVTRTWREPRAAWRRTRRVEPSR